MFKHLYKYIFIFLPIYFNFFWFISHFLSINNIFGFQYMYGQASL